MLKFRSSIGKRLKGCGWINSFNVFIVFFTVFVYSCSGTLKNTTDRNITSDAINMNKPQYVEGEVLIKFKRNVHERRIREILLKEKMVLIEKIDNMNLYRVRIEEKIDVEEAIKRLERYPEVEKAQPNYIRRVEK